MQKKLLITVVMFSLTLAAYSQTNNKKIADSMLNALRISKSNTDRINLLLVLADDYIKKAGEIKVDLDSAAAFLTYARRLNSQLKSQTVLGRILTVEARLNREK